MPSSAGVAAERGQPGVRVLHVEDRVVVGPGRPDVHVDVDRRVHRPADQRVPRGVAAEQRDRLVQGDQVAGPLAHPAAVQRDQLADDDLDGLVRVVAEAGRDRPHAGRRSRGGRRRAARSPGPRPAAACPGSTRSRRRSRSAGRPSGPAPGPCRRRTRWCAARPRRRPRRRGPAPAAGSTASLDLAVGVQRPLGEVDVELGAEVGQRPLDRVEHQLDALGPEDLRPLLLRPRPAPRDWPRPRPRRSARCSRPRSPSPGSAARSRPPPGRR